MATYVLVGGAWLGGWCWQPTARRLREEGHDAYLVTHITDVVNLIEFEDLHSIVLLGHSYAALVVTGAADRIPERISQVVYLDAGPFPSGLAFIDTYPPEARTHVETQVEELGDGWRLPMPPTDELAQQASLAGLDDDQLRAMRSRAVAQPFGTYTQPLRLENPT